jgi:hypothetical protein
MRMALKAYNKSITKSLSRRHITIYAGMPTRTANDSKGL